MATRRIINSEKTILQKDDQPEQKSDISPAVPNDVIFKLLGFTAAMITVPIGSYFLTVHTVFAGNSSYAGGLAAIMANVILIAYVIVAMNEDQSDQIKDKQAAESKKER